jgi:hypothetical protein
MDITNNNNYPKNRMDVLALYRGLSFELQNIIKVYVLSYGTEETRLLKPVFQALQQFNQTNKLTATLWQYNVVHRPNEMIQSTFKVRHQFCIGDELTIAFIQSGLSTHDPEFQAEMHSYAESELQNYFEYRYQSLLVKHKIGTPTALLIRKISGRLKDDWGSTADITLWRIRVFAKNTGKIQLFTYKRKQCMEYICNPPTIYKELIHAYHSGNTFSKRL